MAADIGLGCVTFGREIDKETSFALMDRARGLCITHFDTAAAYGSGQSEAIIGDWLSSRGLNNGQITIATKVLPPFGSAQVKTSVEDSLRRLNADVIDILYLHRWDESVTTDTWMMLEKLKQDGLIKSIGASNFNTAQLKNAISHLHDLNIQLDYIQNNHNLAVSDLTGEMKQLCADRNINVVTYSPLGAGFLTGKHVSGVQPNSRFDIMPGHQDIYFNDEAHRRLKRLLAVAAQTPYAPSFLALAWAFHQPGVDLVLAGGRTVDHLDQAVRAMNFYDEGVFAGLEG